MDTSETKNIIRPEKRGVEYESILKKTAKEGAMPLRTPVIAERKRA